MKHIFLLCVFVFSLVQTADNYTKVEKFADDASFKIINDVIKGKHQEIKDVIQTVVFKGNNGDQSKYLIGYELGNKKVYRVVVNFNKTDNTASVEKFEEVVRKPLNKSKIQPTKSITTNSVVEKSQVSKITPSIPIIIENTQTSTLISKTDTSSTQAKPTTFLTTEPPKETKPAF